MLVFFTAYAGIKFYDARPPSPLLLTAIFEDVLIPKIAQDNNVEIKDIRKNQRVEVEVSIDEILETLNKQYSFNLFCNNNAEHQMPKREWIIADCQMLVDKKESEWIVKDSSIRMFFKKYDNILNHFKEICSDSDIDEDQPSLPFT
jgi:hypothetical protein